MSKKKAIKIATASAIALTGAVAVAQPQADAATNSVDQAITKATKQVDKAFNLYYNTAKKSNKLPSGSAIRKEVKLAEAYYIAAEAEIAKKGGSKAKKAAYTKKLEKSKTSLNRAKNYVAAVSVTLKASRTALDKAIESGKQSTVQSAQAALDKKIAEFEKAVSKVFGPDARRLLTKTYTTPAKAESAAVDAEMKVYAAYKQIERGNLIEKDIEKAGQLIDSVRAEVEELKAKDSKLAGNLVKAAEKNNKAYEAKVEALKVPVVASVSAINAKEIKVTFNKEVDKTTAENVANYELKLKGTAVTGLTADLQEDGKTVLLDKTDGTDIFTNGDYYTVEVEEVLTKDLSKKVATYKTATLNYFDNAAPTVVSSELNGSNVRVYFNEPVSGVKLKVDGSALSGALTSTNKDGKYYVERAASADEKKAGTHSVTVYDATDGDNNILSVAATQYVVSDDTSAPSITSVTADKANTFKVKVSEKLAAKPTFEVKKGGILFIDSSNTAAQVALDSEDSSDLTYIVTVPANAISGSYSLYGKDENSVALSVKITNIKDNSNLTGAEYNGSVTLTKDAVGPKVLSENTNTVSATGVIGIKFDEEISATVDSTKVKVYKDGVLLSVTPSATGTDKFLSIALPAAEVGKAATYSVRLEEGAVKDAAGNKNAALTTTATYAAKNDITPTITVAGTNKYQVAFATPNSDMTDSATTVSNYTLDGKALPAGTTIDFSGDKKTVIITLPKESVAKTSSGSLQISTNVVNKAGQKVADAKGDAFTQLVALTDNVKPVLQSGKFIDTDDNKLANQVELTFSENVTSGNVDDYEFIVNGAKVTATGITFTNDKATVTFGSELNVAQALSVKVLPADDQTDKAMDTVDVATPANELTAGTTITVNTVK